MKLLPLRDNIIIEPSVSEKKTSGGIILPDTAQEKPQQGKVISVGSGRISNTGVKIPVEVKEGDTVFYGKYAGTEITFAEEEYLIMNESEIMAVMR